MPKNDAKRMNHKQINHILVELFKRKDENDKTIYIVAISKYYKLLKKWKWEKTQELTNKRKAYDLYNYSIDIYEEHFAAKSIVVENVPKVH